MRKATFIALAAASVLLAIFCSIAESALPYSVVKIDTRTRGQQFTIDREFYGSTPFFKFIVTEAGAAFDLTGWEFELVYGYDRDATALVSFSGTDYVTVTNNQILVNGTTNFFFEPHEGYYVALQGTHTEGGYSSTFAEGQMDVYYTPAGDPNVPTLKDGITFDLITMATFSEFTDTIYTKDEADALIAEATPADYPAVSSAALNAMQIADYVSSSSFWANSVEYADFAHNTDYAHHAGQLGGHLPAYFSAASDLTETSNTLALAIAEATPANYAQTVALASNAAPKSSVYTLAETDALIASATDTNLTADVAALTSDLGSLTSDVTVLTADVADRQLNSQIIPCPAYQVTYTWPATNIAGTIYILGPTNTWIAPTGSVEIATTDGSYLVDVAGAVEIAPLLNPLTPGSSVLTTTTRTSNTSIVYSAWCGLGGNGAYWATITNAIPQTYDLADMSPNSVKADS
jgi:hypothetical protein